MDIVGRSNDWWSVESMKSSGKKPENMRFPDFWVCVDRSGQILSVGRTDRNLRIFVMTKYFPRYFLKKFLWKGIQSLSFGKRFLSSFTLCFPIKVWFLAFDGFCSRNRDAFSQATSWVAVRVPFGVIRHASRIYIVGWLIGPRMC